MKTLGSMGASLALVCLAAGCRDGCEPASATACPSPRPSVLAAAAEPAAAPARERAGGTVSAQDLLHRRFIIVSVDGKPFPDVENRPDIEFTEGFGVAGQACNRFRGQGELKDGRLFAKQMAMTRMFCFQEELNQLENTLSAMLEAGADIALAGNLLTLRHGGHELIYELQDWVR